MDFDFFKLVIFVPESHAHEVRKALGEAGAGRLGNYDFCSFSSKGVGLFRPLQGAKQFLGEENKLESVEEVKIETICERSAIGEILAHVRAVHPYEEPAIDILPCLDWKKFIEK
jgi:hypothetical protein